MFSSYRMCSLWRIYCVYIHSFYRMCSLPTECVLFGASTVCTYTLSIECVLFLQNVFSLAHLLCVHTHVHACTYVCLCVCMCSKSGGSAHTNSHGASHVCVYVCMHVCIHTCMYVCLYVYMCKSGGSTPTNSHGASHTWRTPASALCSVRLLRGATRRVLAFYCRICSLTNGKRAFYVWKENIFCTHTRTHTHAQHKCEAAFARLTPLPKRSLARALPGGTRGIECVL